MDWSPSCLVPPPHRLALAMSSFMAVEPVQSPDPKYQKATLPEMMDDIHRVISSIAQQFTDFSCPHLHYDELVAEGYLKLAQLNSKGWVERVPNRKEFFAVFKTTVNNHVKGLVHRHRYTMKRTGIRPPPRDVRFYDATAHTKPIEISLDDPDANLQVGSQQDSCGMLACELKEEIEAVLTPAERLVFGQMLEPNKEALIYAELDAHRGRQPGSIRIRVKKGHMAEGLGLDESAFVKLQEQIRLKVEKIMEQPQDPEYNAAVAKLAELFGLQIPGSIEKVVVRRLLTVAARDQADKVNPEVKAALLKAGAKPPEPIHGADCRNAVLQCFGVLWKKNDRACQSCGLYRSCEVEAKNFGLDTVTLSPKLLGARAVRTAQIIPRSEPLASVISDGETVTTTAGASSPQQVTVTSYPVAMNQRDDEILHYLAENFKLTLYQNVPYFKHKEPGQTRLIFCAKSDSKPGRPPLSLRFCNPHDDLKPRLEKVANAWFLRHDQPAQAAIALIDAHAKLSFDSKKK